MSAWPKTRKNDAPRRRRRRNRARSHGFGVAAARLPAPCARLARAFFCAGREGKACPSVGARRRRAITAPESARSAARCGLKSAIPTPHSRLRGLFVEYRACANNFGGRGCLRCFNAFPFLGKSASEALVPEGAARSRRLRRRKAPPKRRACPPWPTIRGSRRLSRRKAPPGAA